MGPADSQLKTEPYGKTKNMGSLVLPSMDVCTVYTDFVRFLFCVCVCVLLLFMLSLVGDYSCLIFRGQFTLFFFFGGGYGIFCHILLVFVGKCWFPCR